jgi:hypothetical protein
MGSNYVASGHAVNTGKAPALVPRASELFTGLFTSKIFLVCFLQERQLTANIVRFAESPSVSCGKRAVVGWKNFIAVPEQM